MNICKFAKQIADIKNELTMIVLKIIGIYILGWLTVGLIQGFWDQIFKIFKYFITFIGIKLKLIRSDYCKSKTEDWLLTYIKQPTLILLGPILILFFSWFNSKVPILFCVLILFTASVSGKFVGDPPKAGFFARISIVIMTIILYQYSMTTMWFGQ